MEKKFQAYDELLTKAIKCLNETLLDKGMDLCSEALKLEPQRCEGYFALAIAAYLIDDLGRAIEMAGAGHEISPECREGCDLLAHLHAHTGNINDSVYFAKLAAAGESSELLSGINVKGLDDLANAINNPEKASYMTDAMRFLNRQQYSEAVDACEKELRLRKNDPAMFRVFGQALLGAGKIGQSISAFQAAVHCDPDHSETLLHLGSAYFHASEPHLAKACYQAAFETMEDVPATLAEASHMHARYLDDPWPELKKAATKWQKSERSRGAVELPKKDKTDSDKDLIHVGFVFDRVCDSDEIRYIEPLLLFFDRNRFSVSVYAKEIPDDPIPKQLSSLCTHWVDISNSTDAMVADVIRRHNVDILIDATITPSGHRPAVFAARPAKHLVNWLAPASGVFAKLYDRSLSDLGEAASVIALEPAKLPMIRGNSPVHARGNLFFSATCDFSKISPGVVSCWSRILRAVPDSRLMLGNVDTIPDDVVRRAHELFSAFGAVDRVEFVELGAQNKSERLIKQIEFLVASDVFLDAFPTSGSVDVALALWSGVPAVVMGEKESQGHAAGIARSAGMGEWVARDKGDYIKKAVAATSAVSGSKSYRSEMHESVNKSRLFQPHEWAQNLGDALHGWMAEEDK